MLETKTVEISGKTYEVRKMNVIEGWEALHLLPVDDWGQMAKSMLTPSNLIYVVQFASIKFPDGSSIPLSTPDLINNHIDNSQDGLVLAGYVIEYNFGFFGLAGSQSFQDCLLQKLESFLTQIVTRLSEHFSAVVSQPSQNSSKQVSKKR